MGVVSETAISTRSSNLTLRSRDADGGMILECFRSDWQDLDKSGDERKNKKFY